MEPKKVKEIMTRDCVTVSIDDDIYEVSVKMKNHQIGFIPVLQQKSIVGVITDRDIVIRGYAEKKIATDSIQNVMTKQVFTILEEATVEEAADIMAEKQIRRLPVVENGELRGVVAIGDLAVRIKYEDEAGAALREISNNTH